MKKSESTLSARPKVRTNMFHEKKVEFEPLEKKLVNFIDQDGNKKSISLISKEFNLKFNCVEYFEPAFEELNNLSQMTLHNFIINCRKFESMLLNLVNLPYFRFWSVMAYNEEVLESLDTYLCNATRSYRLHPVLKNNEIKSVLSNIHQLVFKVFVRIFLPKESEKNYMSIEYHRQIVKTIIDVPEILNLLQLYGYGSNSEILRLLLKDFFESQTEEFKRELGLVCKDITHLFNRYAEDGFEIGDNRSLYNIIANVTDMIFSLNKLIVIEPQFSSIYCDQELPESLIVFYSKYSPFIEQKCDEFFLQNRIVENLYKYLKSQITLTQSVSLLLFHHILQNEYIKPINSNSENQTFDALINILNSVMNQKRFCYDFFTRFSFEQEFHQLMTNRELNDQLSIGDVLEYYKITLKTAITEYLNLQSKKQKNSTNETDVNRLISLSYEPVQSVPTEISEARNEIKTDPETTAKEQMIREMFPDFGDGFVYKCLEHYDFDNEKVLDAILESNLPPHLDSLNRQLNKSDLLRAQSAAISEHNFKQPKVTDKYDPTSTKDLELSQIYIGKKDKISDMKVDKNTIKEKTISLVEKINEEEEEARENVKTMIERGKLTKDDLQTNIEYMGLYEDEFDDTYENEDISFDALDETFDENDTTDDPALPSGNYPSRAPPPPSAFRQPAEKFDNRVQYSKNQFYNKRNYNRKQTHTQDNSSAPRQSQTQSQHSNSRQDNRTGDRQNDPRQNNASSSGPNRGNVTNSRNHPNQNNANRNRNGRGNGQHSYNNNNQHSQNRRA